MNSPAYRTAPDEIGLKRPAKAQLIGRLPASPASRRATVRRAPNYKRDKDVTGGGPEGTGGFKGLLPRCGLGLAVRGIPAGPGPCDGASSQVGAHTGGLVGRSPAKRSLTV